MRYEVTITPSQQIKVDELLKQHSTKINEVFGSYVGNYVGKKKDTKSKEKIEEVFGGYVKTLLNLLPELHQSEHYAKLVTEYPDTFLADGDKKIVPKKPRPATQQSTAKVPGVATSITDPKQDADNTFTDMPHELQIAIKYQSLYNSVPSVTLLLICPWRMLANYLPERLATTLERV